MTADRKIRAQEKGAAMRPRKADGERGVIGEQTWSKV